MCRKSLPSTSRTTYPTSRAGRGGLESGPTLSPKKLSKGHINVQYRRLNRFFNWLVERKQIDENPLDDIEPLSLEEKTVPIVYGRPDTGPVDPGRPRSRQNSRPPLSAGSRPGSPVRVLRYPRQTERNRQAATGRHGLGQRHPAGDGQGP